ncbi:MAG: hypothetical protein ABGY41_01305 [Candidatus Poribacteria bacterium]
MRARHLTLLALLLSVAAWVPSTHAVEMELFVDPPQPTPSSDVTLKIEVTNDNLDPCDYEVRLFANYGGLTEFDREDDGGTIRLLGWLIPHLIPPVEVVPCDVACIKVARQPREIYSEVRLDRLDPGAYHVEVFLPAICGLKTDCLDDGVVDCAFDEPLTLDFTVDAVAPVRAAGRLTTSWAALKARVRGGRVSR